MNNNPTCKFTSGDKLVKNAAQCITKPSPVNCIVKPIVTTTTDPCFQEHMQQQTLNDPYYQHMPKDSAAAATKYAAKMGGENHEISDCAIL